MEINKSILLELGDIIEFNAPNNSDIHNHNFYISYIDNFKIKTIGLSNTSEYIFNLNDDGSFSDETIESVNLLSRSEKKGYAKQNNLLLNTWITIYFGGDFAQAITGEITNIDEDMIEVTTYPDLDIIYIDFAYKGIPEHIPIQSIVISEKPSNLSHIESLSLVKSDIDNGDIDEIPDEKYPSIELLDNGESSIDIPDDISPDSNLFDDLNKIYAESNNIIFGKKLDPVNLYVEVPLSEQRFDIDTQVNDLMDELLSVVPNNKRNSKVLNDIHILITRFKELRYAYSKFDENESIYDIKVKTAFYKPLVESLHKLNKKLSWIVPIVSNTKFICIPDDNNESNDTYYVQYNGLEDLINLQEKYYKQKQNNIDYKTMLNTIHTTFTPFTEPSDDNLNNIISIQNVNDNFEAIIENLSHFKSSIVNKNSIKIRKYIIQKYNLGDSYLKETFANNNRKFERTLATPNDKIFLKSFFFLPKPVIDFSRLHLHKLNMLNRVAYNNNYFTHFRLFNRKLNPYSNTINDLNKELEYKNYKTISSANTTDLLNQVNYFYPNSEIISSDENDYNKFIETLIPKTIDLLKIFRNNLSHCYSFQSVLDEIEPFLVNYDDITYQQYKDIRFIVKENIKKLRENLSKESVLFNKIINSKKINENFENNISRILKDDNELHDEFLKNYNFSPQISNTEMIKIMLEYDYGLLFNTMLSSHMNVLNTPKSLIDILEKSNLDPMDQENQYIDDCFKRYLSKKYDSVEKLHSDNNTDIYFDNEFDDSPYHLLDKYKEEHKSMNKEDFIEFLTVNLKEKHNVPEELSNEIASILVNKQKPVEDGHYALLEINPQLIDSSKLNNDPELKKSIEIEKDAKSKKIYFKRVKNVWIKDDSIDDLSFFDTNNLFCNINEKCFKNTNNNICETEEFAISRFNKHTKDDLLNEFDKRYTINADELQKQNLKKINYYNNFCIMKKMLDDIHLYKYNNIAFLLGSFANNDPVIKSPHSELLNLILNDNDFVKKQHNIIKFVDNYTRSPIITELNEDQWWLYCNDSNIKLLPIFVYNLAEAYVIHNNYSDVLDNIISNQGDDDGKYIVDKYSGWKISESLLEDENLYDSSGHKIIKHDILLENINIAKNIDVKLPKTFENLTTEKIYNIFSIISDSITVPKEEIEEQIMMLSNELSITEIMSKDKYLLKTKKIKEKTGKDSSPYEQYFDETIVLIVSCCLLIAIQTSIPSIITNKTFPGCVRSFSGYPLTGVEDLTGIKYISCVVNKIKSSVKPWNSIKKYNENTIANRMKIVIDKIIKRTDISDLILKKKEYLILNPEKDIQTSIGVEKWTQFLPPLVDMKLPKNISNISNQFKDELYKNILKSREKQFEMYNTIISKNHKFGLYIIQSINDIINKEPLLLNTVSMVPFTDNACCNEDNTFTSPLKYFLDKDETIKHAIKSVNSNITIVNDLKLLSKAPLLAIKQNYYSLFPELSSKFSEETIYHTIIHYCKYDTIYEVPLKFKNICDEKPDDYNPLMTLEEKIVFLKKNDRKFSNQTLITMLNIINKENEISPYLKKEYTIIEPLQDLLLSLDKSNSTIIEEPLRKHLNNVIKNYKKDKFYLEINDNLKTLKNYLIKTNKNLLIQIMDFLNKYGDLNDNLYEKYKNHLFNIIYWNIDTNNDSYFDNGLFNIILFIQNIIYNYTKIYPNIILNGKINNTVPKHWNLSDKHNNDILKIIDEHYKHFSSFVNDESLYKILSMVSIHLTDLNTLINIIPTQSPFKKFDKSFYNLLDKDSILLLGQYSYFSCLYEYILLTDNEEIFNSNIEYNKKIIKNGSDSSDDIVFSENAITDDKDDLLGEDINEINISTGKIENIKYKIAKLLLSFLNMDIDNKKNIDYSYLQTYSNTKKMKNLEKEKIVSNMGNLYKEDRKVENLLKQYKLEKWNLANQKGHISYDKDAYDNDIYANLFQDNNSDKTNEVHFSIDGEQGITDESDIYLEEDNYEGRNYDISELNENFYDGIYYSEDIQEDFFEE